MRLGTSFYSTPIKYIIRRPQLKSTKLWTERTNFIHFTHKSSKERTAAFPCRELHISHAFANKVPAYSTGQPAEPFNILFFGRDEFSSSVLRRLHTAQDVWGNIHIVTNPHLKANRRGIQLLVSPIQTLAQSLNLPIHTIPPEKSAFARWLPPPPFTSSAEHCQLPENYILITASFGRILYDQVLSLFQRGRQLNVHPSLLPDYRGAAPIQHALLRGEKQTGVCVIEMTRRNSGIDAGEIWGRETVPIPEGATFPALRDDLACRGGDLLVSVLRDMRQRKATSIPQDPARSLTAPRAPLIKAKDGLVDVTSMTAEDIVRVYRAISHQKAVAATLASGKSLQLHAISVFNPSFASPDEISLPPPAMGAYDPKSRTLVVRCAYDTFLRIPQVKQENRALLAAKEWWNGIKGKAGVEYVNGFVKFIPGP